LDMANGEDQLNLLFRYTDLRLEEIDQLLQRGQAEDIPEAMNRYFEELGQFAQVMSRISYEDAPNEDALLIRVQQQLQTHEQKLLQLQDRLGDQLQIQEQLQVMIQQIERTRLAFPWEDEQPGNGQGGVTPEGPGQSEPSQGGGSEGAPGGNPTDDPPQGPQNQGGDGSGGPDEDSGQGEQGGSDKGQGGGKP
jgi:hypothetical protein